MKANFDIQYWLHYNVTSCPAQPSTPKTTPLSASNGPDSVILYNNDTEIVLSRIEAAYTDITGSYHDWIKIGFALAHEHGETGRDYFHRVSRFYSKYSYPEADKQYDACIKDNGKGVTIKSFFYMAEQAGIDIVCSENTKNCEATLGTQGGGISAPSDKLPTPIEEPTLSASNSPDRVDEPNNLLFNTPQLPREVYQNLPAILQESCALFLEGIEQDVFLMSVLTVLSGCFPNIEGIYFDEPHSAHLFLFITAPAGSGKGKMKWARYFGQGIHDYLTQQSYKAWADYELRLQEYESLTKPQKQGVERPAEPSRKMFYIPANSSSAAFIQALSENNFRGVIFETEADTLANTTKQDWGDSSDILRKAFHHEPTSMARRKDKEHIEIKDPHLAIVLSGTPKQVHHIMPEVENGLFSRFLYYAFEDNRDFINPFVSHQQVNYMEFFKAKGSDIFDLYQQLQKLNSPLKFKLTDEQGISFTSSFSTMLTKNKLLLGHDLDANIKRLGIITFRIAMILTALRLVENTEPVTIEEAVTNHLLSFARNTEQVAGSQQLSYQMICSDQDFETAITIATTLEKHAIAVYQNMPNNSLKGIRLAFFDKLPPQFDRQGYLKVAEELGINSKTAEKYIHLFQPKLLDHTHNEYTKIAK